MPAILYMKPRQEIGHPPTLAPAQQNARHNELVAPQRAPDPPRSGDAPTRPARRQVYSVSAKKAIRAVMALHQAGVVGKKEFEQFVSQPYGKSLSWDERYNIEKLQPESYGSRFVVSPVNNVDYEEGMRLLMRL